MPAFERHRPDYRDDDAFRKLQTLLMVHPEAGDVIPDTGGLRKLRFGILGEAKVNAVVCD